MKTIWKFPIMPVEKQTIVGPGARVVSCGVDPTGQPCVWAAVDTAFPENVVSVALVPTGDECPDSHEFVGTFSTGPLVWHTFATRQLH